jgi:signal transduction histidine kinase
VFFSIFWLFSSGLYLWMDHSFGEGYISKVNSKQAKQGTVVELNSESGKTALLAGDVALDELKYTLIVLNLILIILIPGLAWLLTSRTLRPIEQSYTKQRQFVSDASHELRTPLTIMQGELDVALKQQRSTAEYQRTLKSTREEVVRLHRLTEALLYIARSDQRTFDMQAVEVDITDAISEVVARLESIAQGKQITVVFEPVAVKLVTNGSNEMLQQLLMNLVENAIKFTASKGTVTITTSLEDHIITVAVVDTGAGMSRQDTVQAFERFYRADESRTKAGFGLGLAICKAIVEQHNGTITLNSELGIGTTATVTLPQAFLQQPLAYATKRSISVR